MKKKLLRTLLLAAALLVGENVWADNANLTPTADTYFSWASDEAKATSYGTEGTLYTGIWQEYWTNGTPGLRDPYEANKHIAVFKFDVSAYKGKITAATFKVTASNSNNDKVARSIYLGYFDLTSWTESSTANNSGMIVRSASGLNIHPFSLSQSIAYGSAEYSFSNDALLTYLNNDEDGIVSLIVYGVGKECSVNSKEAASGKPSLALTYTNETLYTATFTANEGAITPTVTIYSDASRTSTVTNGTLTDKTTYYYRAVLEGYKNYESSFAVDGANPSISFTMTAKTQVTSMKVNYTYNSSTIYTDNQSVSGLYVGDSYTAPFRMYILKDGALYKTTKNGDDPWYGEPVTLEANTVVEKALTLVDLNGGQVVLFEDLDGTTGENADIRASYRKANDNTAYTSAEDLPAGVYTFYFYVQNKDRGSIIKIGETTIFDVSEFGKGSWNEKTLTDVNVPAAGKLTIAAGSKNTRDDYDIIIAVRNYVSAPITSSTGYATFSSTKALDFSGISTLTAYKATACNGTSVTLVPVTGTVAANTGLVINGKTTNIPVVASGDAQAENLLVACSSETPITPSATGTNYVLSVQSDDVVFAPVTGDNATVAADHAFLYVPTATPSRTLNIAFGDEATAISAVQNNKEQNNEVYNLAGQRVAQPAKGLYIVNGKKVIMK